jgi:hypothetical protein
VLRVISILRPGEKATLICSPEGNDFTLMISQKTYEDPEQYNAIFSKAINEIKKREHNELHN